jgi:hypothetical protein
MRTRSTRRLARCIGDLPVGYRRGLPAVYGANVSQPGNPLGVVHTSVLDAGLHAVSVCHVSLWGARAHKV